MSEEGEAVKDEGARHVTYREMTLELRAFRNEMRVLVVGAVVVIRFDVPKELTAAALLAVGAKVGWAMVTAGKGG